jgi:hypothetical protein
MYVSPLERNDVHLLRGRADINTEALDSSKCDSLLITYFSLLPTTHDVVPVDFFRPQFTQRASIVSNLQLPSTTFIDHTLPSLIGLPLPPPPSPCRAPPRTSNGSYLDSPISRAVSIAAPQLAIRPRPHQTIVV